MISMNARSGVLTRRPLGNHLIMDLLRVLLLLVTVSATQAIAQDEQHRVAFIVGNGDYVTVGGVPQKSDPFHLWTPLNDAERYRTVLRDQLDWRILNTQIFNRSAAGLREQLNRVQKDITTQSEVLFIFTGHGFSTDEENFLVGTPEDGQKYTSVDEMVGGSVSLSEVVRRLASNSPRRIILLINACGDNLPNIGANRAPKRETYDYGDTEILVLYSSSPNGVAYDLKTRIESDEAADDFNPAKYLSLFTRSFLPMITRDEPLLKLFAEARIEVEKSSRVAAAQDQKIGRSGLQIPHVLFDSINGEFSLANPTRTQNQTIASADWRSDPRACVANERKRNEALALRESSGFNASSDDAQAVSLCLTEAALNDMGIQSMSFDADEGGVVVKSAIVGNKLQKGDILSFPIVIDAKGDVQDFEINSVKDFRELLGAHYFRAGGSIGLLRKRTINGSTDSIYEEFPS